ncbi:MAG TPA: response regulator transcription factor [Synechococcales cyanobacterium M55_K2018_004]|nr:response regulator transcription factor [Synechococcales cyanobacterium M55_K2018_004]
MEILQLQDSAAQVCCPTFEPRSAIAIVRREQARGSTQVIARETPKPAHLHLHTQDAPAESENTSRSYLRYISTHQTIAIRAIAPEYCKILQEHPLTKRELEILQLIVNGKSNCEIAQHLHVSAGTVKTHVRNILNKLGVSDRTQAAVFALRSGLVD